MEGDDPIWNNTEEDTSVRVCQIEELKRDSDRGYKVAGSCNEEDCKQLEELLFALDNEELGEIDLVTHNIGTSNANPVQILPRKLPSVLHK